MKPKAHEPLFRPGQVIYWQLWRWHRIVNYVVVRISCNRYVLRHPSGSIEKHDVSYVDSRYKLNAKASEEHAVTKVLKKYLNGI
jgi:hypothetical protein